MYRYFPKYICEPGRRASGIMLKYLDNGVRDSYLSPEQRAMLARTPFFQKKSTNGVINGVHVIYDVRSLLRLFKEMGMSRRLVK